MLREFKDEIAALKLALAAASAGGGGGGAPATSYGDAQIVSGVLEQLNHVPSENVHTKYIETEKVVEKVVEVERVVKNNEIYEEAMGLAGEYNKSLVDQRNKLGDELEEQWRHREQLEKRLAKLSK
jgi:hypothetical protein